MQSKDINPAVAVYARVSTEDQAERQTIQGQLDFLRKYCDLHQIPIAGEYVDDGISGTIALPERPEGRRLLDDAEGGRFSAVITYRVDRLARKLTVLIGAYEELDRLGVAIRSGTEPIDTATPIGRMLFHLLGVFAEFEKDSFRERATLGRDRVARNGKYTGGPIPFGYDLDADGRLIESTRIVPELEMTEAEAARDIFTRVANGSTLYAEINRLNALGVQPLKRYSGTVKTVAAEWGVSRLSTMIKNAVYKGDGTLRSRQGTVTFTAPALVDAGLWEAAQAQLDRNRRFSRKNAKHTYLLRGLIRCENCGLAYCGATMKRRDGDRPLIRYRCNGQMIKLHPDHPTRCNAKVIDAAWLEDLVWADCKDFIEHPDEELAKAQRRLRERLATVADHESQRRRLLREIAEKDGERDLILTMLRKRRITMAEAEAQMDAIAKETATARELLESLRAQEALATIEETHLTETAAGLAHLRVQVAEIQAMPDGPAKEARKREIIEFLVYRIRIRTEGAGWQKTPTIALDLAFDTVRTAAVDPTENSSSVHYAKA